MTTSQTHRSPDFDAAADPIGMAFTAAADLAAASTALVANLLDHVDRLVVDVVGDSRTSVAELEDLWEAANEGASAAASVVRAAPRCAWVAAELLRIVAEYRWYAAIRGPRRELFGAAADDQALAALHERSARRLHALCVELRGGVLKL